MIRCFPSSAAYVFPISKNPVVIEYSDIPVLMKKEDMLAIVCAYYGVEPIEVIKKNRKARVSIPRHVCFYMMHLYCEASLNEIAAMFSLHHTSVIHGRDSIRDQMSMRQVNKVKQAVWDILESLPKRIKSYR